MTISPPLTVRNLSWIRAFAVALSALAVVALLGSAAYDGLGHWPAVIALASVAMIAERQGLEISPGLYVSVSFLPMALAAVIYGPGESALIGAVTMLLDYQGWPLERSAIYTAGRTLTGAAAGFAALAVTHGSSMPSLPLLVAASVAAALADMCVNMAVTGITLSLRGRLGLRGLWRMVRGSVVVSMALYAPITALFAYAYNGAGEWVLIFFLIPVLAAHLSLDLHARQARLISELEETNDQLVRTNIHLQRVNLSFAEAMVSALDARDDWTADHSAHVALYSRDIAEELELADDDVARVHLCALVHDIGKIGVPAEVLEKTSALNDDEWAAMREHSAIGATILGQVAGYGDVAAVVRSHHERWDGAGYPDGLAADQIPLMSRIIAVADSYNAMTKDRPYRRAMAPEEAVKQLQLGKWSQFDGDLVEAFLRVLDRESEPYLRGTLVSFSVEAVNHPDLVATPDERPIRQARVA
jgi:putative nucleotidyltransferase with HDIG domain